MLCVLRTPQKIQDKVRAKHAQHSHTLGCGCLSQRRHGVELATHQPMIQRLIYFFLLAARLRARWYLVQRASAGFTRSGRSRLTWALMHLATRLKSRLKSFAHTVVLESLLCRGEAREGPC